MRLNARVNRPAADIEQTQLKSLHANYGSLGAQRQILVRTGKDVIE